MLDEHATLNERFQLTLTYFTWFDLKKTAKIARVSCDQAQKWIRGTEEPPERVVLDFERRVRESKKAWMEHLYKVVGQATQIE